MPAIRVWGIKAEFDYLRVGYFGSSTGGGAGLVAAAKVGESIGAVVSRGGRPDLAGDYLPLVKSPTVRDPLLERAIGVIYLPQTERQSHYFEARLSDQFDAVIHFDETRALEPLERQALWESGEPPETFPTGI